MQFNTSLTCFVQAKNNKNPADLLTTLGYYQHRHFKLFAWRYYKILGTST